MAQYYSGGGFTPGYRRDPIDLGYQVDFLASETYTAKRSGVTIDYTTVPAVDGKRILKGGTAIAKITATGKYGPYLTSASDGRQTPATGLFTLGGDVRCDDADIILGALLTGSVYEARVTGVDSAFKTAVANRITFQ